MFFCLINNYLICYKEIPRSSEDQVIAKDIFDFEKYLSFFDDQCKPFMTEFSKTQGFHNFIERSYSDNDDVQFFKEGVKLCSEQGEKALALQVKRIKEKLLQNNKTVKFLLTSEYSHLQSV